MNCTSNRNLTQVIISALDNFSDAFSKIFSSQNKKETFQSKPDKVASVEGSNEIEDIFNNSDVFNDSEVTNCTVVGLNFDDLDELPTREIIGADHKFEKYNNRLLNRKRSNRHKKAVFVEKNISLKTIEKPFSGEIEPTPIDNEPELS